ncbi:MAG: signal recognition particle-docking protein FtsY [Dehalococcoidia bacterium]|nr:signal recognition particle-docking protein FtsY [Dehalococcoidia bacterium]MDW8120035.1 signal recognition particle-docking protein FtsY [Chloroflexota bacterium]
MFGLFRREKAHSAVQKARQGWFGRLVGLFRRPTLDPSFWDEVEETLLGADVGVSATQRLLTAVRQRLGQEKDPSPATALRLLREEMLAILRSPGPPPSLPPGGTAPRPWVLMVVGVNGVGKTTSIAKLAHFFQQQGRTVLLGAGDTFRAAGIEQLAVWGGRLGCPVVAHQQGADPGAVAYDAYQAAKARGMDILILDTAGRLHTKTPLMEELRKVRRVLQRLDPSAPHLTLLVLDATTGQNALQQARVFTEMVAVNGILLAKLDGTARGGIVLAICQELGLPILFIGTGEGVDDLTPFDPEGFLDALLAPLESGV